MLLELDGIKPQVHETAFVSQQATVIGDVRIGPNSSIWPGAVIRADSGTITIGKGSNVQDNSVIHADDDASIGDGVTIGHGVVCHGKTIGDGSLLGNGSVLNDGVVLGKGCLVAAGSVIPENSNFEDYQLIRGVPGKAIGRLRTRHQQLQQRAALSYVKRIERYKRASSSNNPL